METLYVMKRHIGDGRQEQNCHPKLVVKYFGRNNLVDFSFGETQMVEC